jgi:hypothetical protein
MLDTSAAVSTQGIDYPNQVRDSRSYILAFTSHSNLKFLRLNLLLLWEGKKVIPTSLDIPTIPPSRGKWPLSAPVIIHQSSLD